MAQETLKLTITADTKEALDNLNNFIKANKGLKTEMQNFGKVSNQATQSLINLSRVAQDAPYGFIGIANNINPLLESFQKLQKESGSTGSALKSLVAGIAGPAGIGLAVGVATSLLTVYSKEIADFFKSPTDKLKEFREELKKTNAEVFKIVGEIQANRMVGLNLVNLITGGNTTQQEEALKKLKALYSDNKAIQDAKIGNDKQYYINLVNLAAKQEEAAGKEQNVNKILEQAYTERKKIESKRDADLRNVKQEFGAGGVPVYDINKVKQRIKDNAQKQLDEIDKTIVRAKQKQLEFLTTLTGFETPDKKGGKNNSFARDVAEQRKILDKEFNRIKTTFGTKKDEQYLDAFISPKAKTPEKLQEGMSTFYKDAEQDNAIRTQSILLTKEQTEANLQLADSLSSYAANSFMNLWASMEQGLSIGEALGNLFIDLTKQIAAAAIKAAVFQGIIALFSGGTSVAAKTATGGFGSMFKGLLGLASGGIVTGPTLAMVGEGNESEAVMPLSKLGNLMNNTFNAGAMASNSGNGNGEFVLRGQDLVLAMNRSETALKYRRG